MSHHGSSHSVLSLRLDLERAVISGYRDDEVGQAAVQCWRPEDPGDRQQNKYVLSGIVLPRFPGI
jgi:hypothetical protein